MQIAVKNQNEQFRRNEKRFPDDFAFVLTREEFTILILQNAISRSHGGPPKPAVAFVEHGAKSKIKPQTSNSR